MDKTMWSHPQRKNKKPLEGQTSKAEVQIKHNITEIHTYGQERKRRPTTVGGGPHKRGFFAIKEGWYTP